ncbi:ABC transporter substrate-binding protein [Uliginosibacterium gangwonense]|uniref:ABC transporter substrate-binding protein n=1 Tax=Uliginosibacterium gangwonense TaxID=392736 RepID=UPI000687C7C0|nr:ABC transporter substrate-binding protein [Uliginosibacterium gangwonense]
MPLSMRLAIKLFIRVLVCSLSVVCCVHAETIRAPDPSQIPAEAKARKNTLIATIAAPQGVFNPYLISNGWDENVTAAIFGNLVGLDRQGKPVSDQAESWTISPDGLVYTFKLAKNLKFSDGSPLTASDVAFTLTFLYDPAYDGETDISLAHIKGGDAYKKGAATSISGIVVINPQTIQITVTEPGATTLTRLGGPILSKAYYGKNYQKGKLESLRALSNKPIGSGPYVYENFVPGQEVRFKANPYYFKGKPAIENFIYRITTDATRLQLFQTGGTDIESFPVNSDNIEQLKEMGFANIHVYPSSDFSLIDFNHKKPYLKDARVRQALIYGLDRKKLVDLIYQGNGSVANLPIAPLSWAYNPSGVNTFLFDPAKARALLDQAGFKPGKDGVREKNGQRLSLTLLATKSQFNDALIPIAKESYKAIGVELNAEISDFNALLAKRKAGSFDLATYRTSGLSDPHDGVKDFRTNENKFGYGNPKVDDLITKGNETSNITQRKEIYHQLYQVLANDPPCIFLAYRNILSASNSRVTNYQPNIYLGLTGILPELRLTGAK